MKCLAKIVLVASLLGGINGCAVSRQMAANSPQEAAPASSKVVERSLFSKDITGALTEADLQTILASPIDLQLPARVGVVPLAAPFDPEKPVSIRIRSVAAHSLARALGGCAYFSHVSDISTDLPNVGGVEGLRVLAARYRLRYLLLYTERFEQHSHLNGWAWLYPTVIGIFAAPGLTVRSEGLAQVDLLDVRNGTVLFSIVEPMRVSDQQWLIGSSRAQAEQEGVEAAGAARRLAKRVVRQTNLLVAWADRVAARGHRRVTRILPPPIAPANPPASPPPSSASPPPSRPSDSESITAEKAVTHATSTTSSSTAAAGAQ